MASPAVKCPWLPIEVPKKPPFATLRYVSTHEESEIVTDFVCCITKIENKRREFALQRRPLRRLRSNVRRNAETQHERTLSLRSRARLIREFSLEYLTMAQERAEFACDPSASSGSATGLVLIRRASYSPQLMSDADATRTPAIGPRASVESEGRALLRLAAPVMLAQVGLMLMGVVDTVMVGQLSVVALDAAALGHIWVMGTSVVACGVLGGLAPIVSQSEGAGRHSEGLTALASAGVLALVMVVPLVYAWLNTSTVLIAFGQDPELSRAAELYVRPQIYCLPLFLLSVAAREWLQSRGLVWPIVVVMAVANVVNVGLNQIFIFGWQIDAEWLPLTLQTSLPGWGLVGAGWATSLGRAILFIGIAVLTRRAILADGRRGSLVLGRGQGYWVRRIFIVGLPIGVQYGLEVWAFQLSSLMAGRLGHIELAAHTIVLNIASLTYMAAMGISVAAATRVGAHLGGRAPIRAHRSAWLAIGLGSGWMATAGVVLVVGRSWLPGLYTQDAGVLAAAGGLMIIAAIFQVFDGTQCVAGGVLRGMGRTRPAAAGNLVAFYLIGLPLAWYWCFELNLGVRGIWWGLCVGLGLMSMTLCLLLAWRGPKSVRELLISDRAGL